MNTKTSPAIWSAHARVADRKAITALLAPLPPAIAADVGKLAARNGRGKCGMRYDATSAKAFFIQHDATGVLAVVTFEDIHTVEIAGALWAAIDEARSAERLDQDDLHAIYARITGYAIENIGRRS